LQNEEFYLVENTENYLVSASVSAHRGLKSRNTGELGTEGEEGLHKLPSSMQSKTSNIVKIVNLPHLGVRF